MLEMTETQSIQQFHDSSTITTATNKCRVCLKDGAIPIFGDANSEDISENIIAFTGVTIRRDDNLPKYLCYDCHLLLEAAILLKNTAMQTDLLLRNSKPSKTQLKSKSKTNLQKIFISLEGSNDEENGLVKQVQTVFEELIESLNSNPDHLTLMQNGASEKCKKTMEEIHENGRIIIEGDVFQIPNYDNQQEEQAIYIENLIKNKGNQCKSCNQMFSHTKHYFQHMRHVHKIEPDPDLAENNYSNDFENFILLEGYNEENDIEKQVKTIFERLLETRKTKPELHIMLKSADVVKKNALEEHKKTADVQKNYKSDGSFEGNDVFNIHDVGGKQATCIENIKKMKVNECKPCKLIFTQSILYIEHMKQVHDIKSDSGLADNFDSKSSHTVKSGKTKIECPFCKKFFSQCFIKQHVAVRHTPKEKSPSFVCDICGRQFVWHCSFTAHQFLHTNKLPFHCDHCPYRGRTKALLKMHILTHTKEYKHKCTQCSARYLLKTNLRKHMKTHGSMEFMCDICKKAFRTKPTLKRHVQAVHLGHKDHVCDMCGMKFGFRKTLLNHQFRKHNRAKLKGGRQPFYMTLEKNCQ